MTVGPVGWVGGHARHSGVLQTLLQANRTGLRNPGRGSSVNICAHDSKALTAFKGWCYLSMSHRG